MIIESTKKGIVFRLPQSTRIDFLQDLVDLFEFKEIAKKSTATQKDVDSLVKRIKKGRWAKTKSKIEL